METPITRGWRTGAYVIAEERARRGRRSSVVAAPASAPSCRDAPTYEGIACSLIPNQECQLRIGGVRPGSRGRSSTVSSAKRDREGAEGRYTTRAARSYGDSRPDIALAHRARDVVPARGANAKEARRQRLSPSPSQTASAATLNMWPSDARSSATVSSIACEFSRSGDRGITRTFRMPQANWRQQISSRLSWGYPTSAPCRSGPMVALELLRSAALCQRAPWGCGNGAFGHTCERARDTKF